MTPFNTQLLALSIQCAATYKIAYDSGMACAPDLLQAHIAIRQALPYGDDGKHIGHEIVHPMTQVSPSQPFESSDLEVAE